MAAIDPEAQKILALYGEVFEAADFNKIRCTVTRHEVPNKGKALQEYTSTKKFQTAWKIHELMVKNPGIFEDLDENLVGCKITKKVISRDPEDMKRHLEGKRLKKAIARGITGDESEPEEEEDDDMSVGGEEDEEIEDEEGEDEVFDIDYDIEEEMEVDVKSPKKESPKKNKKASNIKEEDKDAYDFCEIVEEKPKAQKRKTEGKGIVGQKKKKRTA